MRRFVNIGEDVVKIDGDPRVIDGAYMLEYRRAVMRVIASTGRAWDHVSVSLATRCPTWDEMAHVKGIFFLDDETVFQFHPRSDQYVNHHPNCLHLWRPQAAEILLPPAWMIGPRRGQTTPDMVAEAREQGAY